MFSPGSKNWIKKFFALADLNRIDINDTQHLVGETDNDPAVQIQELSENTGLIYGSPNKLIFCNHLVSKATKDERLQLLLFESLIFIHRLHHPGKFDAKAFMDSLVDFYQMAPKEYGNKWYHFLHKRDTSHQLEKLFSKRVKIKSSYGERNFWFNHLSNNLVYIDLILFHSYCIDSSTKHKDNFASYAHLILGVMYGILNSTETDPLWDQRVLRNLVHSSDMDDEQIRVCKSLTVENPSFESSIHRVKANPMLAHFTFHVFVLLYNKMPVASFTDQHPLHDFGHLLGLQKPEIEDVFWDCRKSMSEFSPEYYDLLSDSETRILFTHLTRKYHRVLGRNKDKFVRELKESKELISLVHQSTTRELTPEEKEKVKAQFKDLMKTVPSIGIYLLPGGSLWLPLILKLIPDLLPSAFKDNDLKSED